MRPNKAGPVRGQCFVCEIPHSYHLASAVCICCKNNSYQRQSIFFVPKNATGKITSSQKKNYCPWCSPYTNHKQFTYSYLQHKLVSRHNTIYTCGLPLDVKLSPFTLHSSLVIYTNPLASLRFCTCSTFNIFLHLIF